MSTKQFQSNPTLGQEYRAAAPWPVVAWLASFNPTRPSARNIAMTNSGPHSLMELFQSNPTLGQEYRSTAVTC